MDILPFSPIVTLPPEDEGYDSDTKSRGNLLEVDSEGDWCLFTVDVKNAYTLPFEVHFGRNQEGTKSVSCSRLVPPGSTSRYVEQVSLISHQFLTQKLRITLPIRRLFLSNDKISQSIPTLSDRQFVVAKVGPGNVDQVLQRELFWYREELFNSVTARWKEVRATKPK
jgi:hypothetical protein